MTRGMLQSEKILITGATELLDVEGVGGICSAALQSVHRELATAPGGQTLSCLSIDGDPVATAQRRRPVLENRCSDGRLQPLFAASLRPVAPHDFYRYLP